MCGDGDIVGLIDCNVVRTVIVLEFGLDDGVLGTARNGYGYFFSFAVIEAEGSVSLNIITERDIETVISLYYCIGNSDTILIEGNFACSLIILNGNYAAAP